MGQLFRKVFARLKALEKYPATLYYHLKDLIDSISSSQIFISNRKDTRNASMLLLIHSLEKGLSIVSGGRKFGGGKAETLAKLALECSYVDSNSPIVALSLSALKQYIESPNAELNANLLSNISALNSQSKASHEPPISGVKSISPCKFDFNSLMNFASSRSSIRNFSSTPLKQDQISNAIKFAQTAPSACNRQASRIHIFFKKDIQRILDVQLGDQGWGLYATTLFVITSNSSYFNTTYERSQALIDGGIFSMQFLMGLHAQGIASCCKMYVRTPSMDHKFRAVTNIPHNEIPILLILAGNYLDHEVSVPASWRFPESYVSFIHNS